MIPAHWAQLMVPPRPRVKRRHPTAEERPEAPRSSFIEPCTTIAERSGRYFPPWTGILGLQTNYW